jgi:hypothetical protein
LFENYFIGKNVISGKLYYPEKIFTGQILKAETAYWNRGIDILAENVGNIGMVAK